MNLYKLREMELRHLSTLSEQPGSQGTHYLVQGSTHEDKHDFADIPQKLYDTIKTGAR
jgi:hypothetical protein